MKKFFFIFLFTAVHFQIKAQTNSHLRIALLTCSPGDELYSIFGHSAIRITDSIRGSDIVYNYGTFDFDDASFYLKFIRGKLLYYVSAEYYGDFEYLYRSTGRGITEQVLNISDEEKMNFQQALNTNIKEENKYYKYDFFFDNCTTRLRDFIVHLRNPSPVLPAVMDTKTTFRNAIHQYLDHGQQYWSKFGIDILLGARTDRIMKSEEQQFLPDNLMMALDKSSPKLVAQKNNYPPLVAVEKDKIIFTPLVCFSLLLIFFILISQFKNERIQLAVSGLDGILFFTTGLLGFILIFMWAGTDHSMTKNNYNLLWALPTHLFAAFFINSKKTFIKKYFLYTAYLMIVLLIAWAFLPQQMNPALIPFVILLIYRSALKYFSIR